VKGTPDLFAELFNPANYSFDERSLWHFGAALLVAVCGGLMLRWERGSRISRFFAAFCLLFLLWASARGLMRLLIAPELVLLLSRHIYVLLLLSLPFLYQFAMILLRTETQRATLIWVNWGTGMALALACIGSESVIAGVTSYGWGLEPHFGVLGVASLLWTGFMMVTAGLDAFRVWQRTQPGTQERRRITLFCIALAILYCAAVDFLPSLGFAVYPWAFVPVSLFTLLTAWITQRYGLVEVNAQLAAQEIAGLVRGALLILDRDGAVQFANPFAESVLSLPHAALVGAVGRKLLGDSFHPENLAQLSRMEGRDAEREILYQTPGGGPVRDLALSAVAVRDRHARDVAFVCLLRDITEQKRVQQLRLTEGLRDALTGLPGRTMFLELLDSAVKRAAASSDYDFAVCFIGLDRLNVVNEDLGYSAGDQVLAEIARRLRQTARAQDTVARVGGDEFGLLLDGAGHERVQGLALRLQQAIRAPLRLSDHDLHVSASVGIAESTFTYASGAEILRDAGIAMHRAKEAGGGGTHFLARADRGTQRTRLEADMRRALEAREFQVYYQPVLDLIERRVAGFEALVRWQHPERGLVMPGAFIELAEQIGLSRDMDLYVMEQACAKLARFQELARERKLSLSFNMAEAGLRDPQFTERVGATLARYGLDPSSVRIELLERVATLGPLRGVLTRLRGLGVGLAIDDFGTGYSSLSRLHELPLTVLKVDREFVQAMAQTKSGEKVVTAILALGANLGLTVIAEGAGQMREARRLRDLGCRYVQGFYFSQAVPFEQALAMVREPQHFFGEKFSALDAAWLAPAAAMPVPAAIKVADVEDTQPSPKQGKWFGRH
jgi:diguanylate cyclase (GGDEF)-like protein